MNPLSTKKEIESLKIDNFRDWPRVSSWIPDHEEIYKLSEYYKSTKNSGVIDVGCGRGLATHLLSQEGLPITGIDNQITHIVRTYENGPKFEGGLVQNLGKYQDIGGIFASWMPDRSNWAPYFEAINPEIIAVVINPCTNFALSSDYDLKEEWTTKDKYTGFNASKMKIFTRKDSPIKIKETSKAKQIPYNWE